MNLRLVSAKAGLLGLFACFTALVARGQVTAGTQPSPPPQICANGVCVNSAPAPNPTSGSQSIKWNPGHYMASYTVIYGGSQGISFLQPEMNDLANQDAIQGYRIFITWGELEPTAGNYNFSLIDAILAQLQTAYNKPKHLVVSLWLYSHSANNGKDGSVIPLYVQQSPAYGASPVAGSYGWWGKNSNGASTGMYAPALYYQPVMDRLIGLVQALGNHLDGNPLVEGLMIQEDATIAQAAANLGSLDPNYSDGAWLTQLERLLTAATAAFPHTSVIMNNTYFVHPESAIALEQWMASNRIAAGAADSMGQSALTTYGTGIISNGLETYIGAEGGTDLRQKMTAMMDVQGPDLYTNYFNKYGGPWTAVDIINAFNQTYYASHAFWTHLTGSSVPASAQWSTVAAACAANPLVHTNYPANYP